ncbi:heme peroxidase [Armillaria nabsnona]|nr:heme peroxidase [Armillaria nabsnona]
MARQADGTLNDDDLAQILQDTTDKTAGVYHTWGMPAALRTIEIMGMEQDRRWGCCTMNEFREFLGLPSSRSRSGPPTPRLHGWQSSELYRRIDNLELYPGLQAEDCMSLGSRSGICGGYTIMRVILADAIVLVRSDRFYITDFTPENLTSWGIQDCACNHRRLWCGAAEAPLPPPPLALLLE